MAQRARILLADDDDGDRRLLVALLEGQGHEVHAVVDGVAAVRALLASGYDLVLMGCHMPGLDGYEATREIRRREQGFRTPVIALTAAVDDEARRRSRDVGMDDHLAKPVTAATLARTVARWVGASRPSRGPASSAAGARARLRDVLSPADFARSLQLFLEDAPRRLDAARTHLAAGELAAAGQALHALKGTAGFFGLPRLAELATAGVVRATAGEDGPLAGVLEGIASELEAVLPMLLEEQRAAERAARSQG